jgi:hypothetical protein
MNISTWYLWKVRELIRIRRPDRFSSSLSLSAIDEETQWTGANKRMLEVGQ